MELLNHDFCLIGLQNLGLCFRNHAYDVRTSHDPCFCDRLIFPNPASGAGRLNHVFDDCHSILYYLAEPSYLYGPTRTAFDRCLGDDQNRLEWSCQETAAPLGRNLRPFVFWGKMIAASLGVDSPYRLSDNLASRSTLEEVLRTHSG